MTESPGGQSVLDYILASIFQTQNISILLNQAIQIYCFVYGLLCGLTAIFQATNFIYAESLVKLKPIGIFFFGLFWYMKMWTSFDEWMVWINFAVSAFIAVYYYDCVCNITSNIMYRKDATRIGLILLLAWFLFGTFLWIVIRRGYIFENGINQGFQTSTSVKQGSSSHTQLFYKKTQFVIYLSLSLVLLAVNYFRIRQRSLFPSIITLLVTSLVIMIRMTLLSYGSLSWIPIEAGIYLLMAIDAEGREFQSIDNKVVHYIFMACCYFYGFVITNQRGFRVEFILLAIVCVMILFNR